ncbi:alpha/beta hydrolase [Pleomorphovibrio marinus]|uniref:alpha/beta hydrolase n=1 Tax=Pleomorphovibrio marinus TaxID=2164132 RepID=UPI000E0C2E38|nr:alpha/beta hydrolase [Pleomorphovibrio marinus]
MKNINASWKITITCNPSLKKKTISCLFIWIGLAWLFPNVCVFGQAGQEDIYIPPIKANTTLEFPAAVPTHDNVRELIEFSRSTQISYEKDVEYINREDNPLHLQVIRARDMNNRKMPALVFVPGSAWKKQNVYASIPKLSAFAERGFTVFIVEYRATDIPPYHPFPAQVQDVKTAIRFIRKNSERFDIDPDQLFLWGTSSGGHTAVMVGVTEDKEDLDTDDYSDYSSKVNAIVNYFGPTDIAKMNAVPSTMDHVSPESPEGLLIGGKNVMGHPELVKASNPITYLDEAKSIPPLLIMHGNRDRLVPFNQSELLADAMKDLGKEYTFYMLKDADHGSYEFWTEGTLDIVEAFLRSHFK